jgi:hypothetical protein
MKKNQQEPKQVPKMTNKDLAKIKNLRLEKLHNRELINK